MKRLFGCLLLLMSFAIATMDAQQILTLDSCRTLAVQNNWQLRMADEEVEAARYERKAAHTAYLPKISATGAYFHNQKELSLLDGGQKRALNQAGTNVQKALQEAFGKMLPVEPSLATWLQPLASLDLAEPLNVVGHSVVDALRTDTRNVWLGAVSLTQPVYAGGKIRAYNQMAHSAELLAWKQRDVVLQSLVMDVDEAYWRVVSLAGKVALARSLHQMVQALESDMQKMIAAGVATRADGLAVEVRLNEAELALLQADDGLALSRMALCQLCGLPLESVIRLADESLDSLPLSKPFAEVDTTLASVRRPELQSLALVADIYENKIALARADFLPDVALTANYVVSNPSLYNGFEQKFKGMWNVGVLLNIPLFQWGEGKYKVRAARAEARRVRQQWIEARQLVSLQVRQAVHRLYEARQRLVVSQRNVDKAEDNLYSARKGFQEGVIPATRVLEAQTAWISARSARLDAQIDVRLADAYLRRAVGVLE